jgi:hypothetical protein
MKRCGSATNEESRPPALPWRRGEMTVPSGAGMPPRGYVGLDVQKSRANVRFLPTRPSAGGGQE